MTDLSVVIITKNQVWNVDRLLGSVLQENEDVSHCGGPARRLRARRTAPRSGPRSIRSGFLRLFPNQPLTGPFARPVGRRPRDHRRPRAVPGRRHGAVSGLARPCAADAGRAARRRRVAGTVVDVQVRRARHDRALARRRRGGVAQEACVPREITNTGGAALHRAQRARVALLPPPLPAAPCWAFGVPAHP